jgi:hypothetical protein
MNDTPWFVKHKSILRQVTLALLFVSLLGPWAYDLLYVPGEYPCEWPIVRLYSDFCGMPMSWFSGFLLFAGDFFRILWALITGTFTGRGRELFGLVFLTLPILPLFSTLLLLRKKDSPRLRRFHLIALGLGCIFPLFILFAQQNVQVFLLWGPWLYIFTAVGAWATEILFHKAQTRLMEISKP